MRRQLIGDVSHELRTPLAAIKGSMEALIDGVLPAEPETFEHIYQEADRLQRLVNDLQELSRVKSGAFNLDLQPLLIADLLQTVTIRLGRQFAEKGVRLEIEIPSDLPEILADADRLSQVLFNLIGNALQYTPAGGQVTVAARQQRDEVQVNVQDTGIGMPPSTCRTYSTAEPADRTVPLPTLGSSQTLNVRVLGLDRMLAAAL